MIFVMIGNILIYCTHIFSKCSRNKRHTLIHVQDLLWIFLLVVDVAFFLSATFCFNLRTGFSKILYVYFCENSMGFVFLLVCGFSHLIHLIKFGRYTRKNCLWRMQWVDFQSKFKMKTVLDCMHNGACQMQICENGSLLPKELCRNCI